MSPNVGLLYSASSVNGPVGYGWTIQGISMITRCQGNKAIDGVPLSVAYGVNDKLCLDGQRLIQTDATGAVVNAAVVNPGTANPFQQNDSLGGTGLVREYRTEKDIYARIRAYGSAGGNTASGPAYFKVWTKSGQIYEYGINSNATANAQITAGGQSLVVAWPVSRIADTVGNYIDFQYEQRDVAWGSGAGTSSPTAGHEWNLLEIRYTGNAAQLPANKVVFEYLDRADTPNAAQDRGEAYHQGSKNVSIRLLNKVKTYINWPAGQTTQPASAIKVKTLKLTYGQGSISKRSQLQQIAECAGAAETSCLSPVVFNYAAGGDVSYTANALFKNSALSTLVMQSTTGNYGVITGNFFGSGRADMLRWSDTPTENQLYRSAGDGTFAATPAGSGAGSFNITNQNLNRSDGCFTSMVADFNGDGLSDILRIMRATSASGASCGTVQHILYLSNGDGSFSSSNVTGIDFTQVTSVRQDNYYCGQGFNNYYTPTCPTTAQYYTGTTQTAGQNFHLLDVNNDGFLDIVATIIPYFNNTKSPPSEATQCASIICTHVFLGQAGGGFSEQTTTNLAHRSVYADPAISAKINNFWRIPYVADANGDGMADLLVNSGVWLSRGDGNFDVNPGASGTVGCQYPLDFNGDGRADCLMPAIAPSGQNLLIADGTYAPKNAGNFNLLTTGQELFGTTSTNLQNIGVAMGDFDGDGRSDILRWKDDPSQNTVYLSNGDGTFRASAFNLTSVNDQLQKSDGTASFLTADFTGHGNSEILALRANPATTSDATRNQLYVKTNSTPPDQLVSVTSSTGLVTTLTWVPLSNSVSGSLGARYASDGGMLNAAVYPAVDLTLPTYVVATTVSDSGVGAGTQATEYSYAGLKMAYDGRGLLGFRETRRQNLAPNGNMLTVFTQNLQSMHNVGPASLTETRLGALNASGAQVISRSTYVYCDKTAASGAETSANNTTPCPTSALVQRPYLYQSVEQGWDLGANQLPKVTTTNFFNNSGDPTQIVVKTEGIALGLAQAFTKTSSNQYYVDNSSGDNWILGRLQQATVLGNVPNSFASIATSAGAAPSASLSQDQILAVSISPNPLNVNASAAGTASGVISANASGGVAPYSYSWARTTGTRTSASNSTAASPTIGATLVASDNFTESWKVI